jgi:hypothetical protein
MYTRNWYEQQRREKETAEQRAETDASKAREMNDMNFPTLVSSFAAPAARASGHGWHQRGSDLARAWGEAADEQKEVETLRKQLDEHRAIRDHVFAQSVQRIPLPFRSGSSNQYAEDAYPEEDEDAPEPVVGGAAGDEVWTTVDSTAKKSRPVRRTGDWHHLAEHEEPHDDSVWGGGTRDEDDSVW